MKTHDRLDKLFKSTVEPVEIMPHSNVWDSIDILLEKQQTKKYKRRALIFQSLSIALLILLTGIIAEQHFIQVPSVQRENNNNSQVLNTSENNSSLANNDKGIAKATAVSSRPKNSQNGLQPASKSFIRESNTATSSSNNHPTQHPLWVLNKNSASSKRYDIPGQSIKTTEIITNTKNNASGTSTPDEHPVKNNAPTDIEPISSVLLTEGVNTATDTNAVQVTPLINTSTYNSNPLQQKAEVVQQNKFISKISLLGFFSPQISDRFLKTGDNNNTNANESTGDFNNQENNDFSYSSGLKAEYALSDNWSVASGCTYSVFSQTIKPTPVFYKTGDNGQPGYYFTSSTGTVDLPNYSSSAPQIGDSLNFTADSKQSVQAINIPLLVKYRIAVRKLSYYVFSGLSFNFLINETTTVNIQTSGTEEQEKTNNQIEGLKRMNCGFIFGFGLQYNFTQHLSISLEPAFNCSFTSINKNTPVSSFPYSIGIGTGIGYRF